MPSDTQKPERWKPSNTDCRHIKHKSYSVARFVFTSLSIRMQDTEEYECERERARMARHLKAHIVAGKMVRLVMDDYAERQYK